ncbi:MAG: OadG-related small transporter subunit [Aerococcus sp.]|nr:OadG-related small transporter subunit [Aerococcus sp.]
MPEWTIIQQALELFLVGWGGIFVVMLFLFLIIKLLLMLDAKGK